MSNSSSKYILKSEGEIVPTDELHWYSFSPVVHYFDEQNCFAQRFNFSDEIFVEPIPNWLENLPEDHRLPEEESRLLSESSLVIASEYTAASLGDPDPNWRGATPRGIQDIISEKMLILPVAIWLVRATGFSTSFIAEFRTENSYRRLRNIKRGSRLLVFEENARLSLSTEDLVAAKSLYGAILNLSRPSMLWSAIRIFHKSLIEQMWEVRYLLQWVVLESLYGPDDPGESTHKICERLAIFLENSAEEASSTYHAAKTSYKWRSKIVHGLKLTSLKPEDSEKYTAALENLIRRSFTKILSTPEMISNFNGDRDAFLSSLIFKSADAV